MPRRRKISDAEAAIQRIWTILNNRGINDSHKVGEIYDVVDGLFEERRVDRSSAKEAPEPTEPEPETPEPDQTVSAP